MNDYLSPDFPPAPDELCFCPSGKPFKHCCGDTSEGRSVPYGIHILNGEISEKFCNDLHAFANKQKKEPLIAHRFDLATGKNVGSIDPDRVTDSVRLGKWRGKVDRKMKEVLAKAVAEIFGQEPEWFERPDLLCYTAGGHYKLHADSEQYMEKYQYWKRVHDRDYSLLFYLNDEFTGGQLTFTNFQYKYQPRRGDVVIFPSDHRYTHRAEPVESGIRYALVTWCAVKGGVRVCEGAPHGAIKFNPQ